ncbi:MAG: hypothetical protein VCA34_10415 [Roseibacillus sp.]
MNKTRHLLILGPRGLEELSVTACPTGPDDQHGIAETGTRSHLLPISAGVR